MQNFTKHDIFPCSEFLKNKWVKNNLANFAHLRHQIQKLFHSDASTELIVEELDCLMGQVVEGSYAAKWCRPDSAVVLLAKFCFKYILKNTICMWNIYKIYKQLY